MPPRRREIAVDYLARVEGEGSMYLEIAGDEIVRLEFDIFEPPRFFEALLRGRRFDEAPDLTARICGICPVAYQTSAAQAMEDAAGIEVGPAIEGLRRLLFCGEWIESHALHVFLLHAPDFLGYQDGIALATDFPDQVRRGLSIKRTGNALMRVIGGREIHPVNFRVGGFYRLPTRRELEDLVPQLEAALRAAEETVRWVAGFPFPDFERDYEFVALRHPDEYPITRGRIASTRGIDIAPDAWASTFAEHQVPRSNALHARVLARGAYLVGPLARYALNRDLLTPRARAAADSAGLGAVCRNPFRSIVVRAVEIVFACEEALRLIETYDPPTAPAVTVQPGAGVGHGVSEAPRGVLYHRYEIDDQGLIRDARIVAPTSQNQLSIEEDLRAYATPRVGLDDEQLQWELEQAIRNYDPCISCATHFLDLTVRRRPP